MKKALLFFLLMFGTLGAFSQSYNNAFGVRFGWDTGLSYKHFLNSQDAIEGILSTRYGGFYLVGLYERHMAVDQLDNTYFFYGGGAHIGTWGSRSNLPAFDEGRTASSVGIDGVAGVEYRFPKIPLNMSLDVRADFSVGSFHGFTIHPFALSVRYVIN